jgi:putative membrane protein
MAHIGARNRKGGHERVALSADPLVEGIVSAERPVVRGGEGYANLREGLAVQRSALANERTLLAYVRTALVLAVAGIALVQFFGRLPLHVLGWIFVWLGVLTLVLGALRFVRVKRRIREFVNGRRGE